MSFYRILFFQFLLFLFISCDNLQKDSKISFLGPVLEAVNNEGRLEYTGRIINNSNKEIKNLLVRYIAKNSEGKIIEAVTIPIKGAKGRNITEGEIIDFQFTLRSNTRNVFDKKLTLDYIE